MKWVALDEELGWTCYEPGDLARDRKWLKSMRHNTFVKEIPDKLANRLLIAESAMKVIQDEITAIKRKDSQCSE